MLFFQTQVQTDNKKLEKNIIHVVHVIANNSSVPYLNWFAERLDKYPDIKFTVIALYPEKPRLIYEMNQYGCSAYWIKYDQAKRKSGMIYTFFKLVALLSKLKPDVINTHLFDDSLPALMAARLVGIKKRVIRKQETAFHWYYTPYWVWADRLNNFNSTHIIAISEDSKKFLLEKERAPFHKVHMIHNGIPVDKVTTQVNSDKEFFRKKYMLQGKIVLGTVARYIEWKGYKYIIEAARILIHKNKNFRFLFIGSGEQQGELEELVNKYGLSEYVIFTNWIESKYMPSVYGLMDIYVHAAIKEPFGFVLIEAMANGVPIITSKTGVAADVLEHKVTCYYTADKDPEGIADGVEWLFANPLIKKAMGEKSKQIVKDKFTIERMFDEHVKIYYNS